MSKLVCEIILSNISKVKNINFQIIRPFNISGARQLKTGGFVMPTFVNQALSGKPITVFGDGNQVRSFTHAEDIMNGVDLILKNGDPNEIWNVGTDKNRMTILTLAEKVKEICNSNSEIVLVNPKDIHGPLYEEAWDKVPNSKKIINKLNWKPKWIANDIIKDVVDFYKIKL